MTQNNPISVEMKPDFNKDEILKQHLQYPIAATDLIRLAGAPASEDDTMDHAYFRRAFPVIKTMAALNFVVPLMDRIYSEFCCAFTFHPKLVSHLCQLGFFPMAFKIGNRNVLLIKLHRQRCALQFNNLHIPKRVKKRSKAYRLTIDKAFSECIRAINDQHQDSWLYPDLVTVFEEMHQSESYPTKLHSFELWEGNELVAGEIGFAVGRCYSSLSGFYRKNSTGTIQMCATARLLQKSGFLFWDLGMEMEYKMALGAQLFRRDHFLKGFYKARKQTADFKETSINVGYLIR